MGMRAVIMADDDSIQELLELILTQRGLTILSTRPSGAPRLADVLVLDSGSLVASGPEKLRELFKQWSVVAQNVVFFADVRSSAIAEVERLGCRVITKPFRLGEIFDWLDECEQRIGQQYRMH